MSERAAAAVGGALEVRLREGGFDSGRGGGNSHGPEAEQSISEPNELDIFFKVGDFEKLKRFMGWLVVVSVKNPLKLFSLA